MSELRLAICDPAEDTRESLKQLVMGIDRVCLEADCSRYEFFFDVAKQTEPEVCLVNIDTDLDSATRLITKLNQSFPKVGIIAISTSTEGSLILQIMRRCSRISESSGGCPGTRLFAGTGVCQRRPCQTTQVWKNYRRCRSVRWCGYHLYRRQPGLLYGTASRREHRADRSRSQPR